MSYARQDDPDYVRRFYRALSDEVRIKAALASDDEVGFLDSRDIDLGARWPEALSDALAESAVFIALCSPLYFKSDYCGREWAGFAERMERYQLAHEERPPVLLPLMWIRNTQFHPVAAELQYTTDDLGTQYLKEGLRNCMRVSSFRDQRIRFIESLAEKIVGLAERYELPRPVSPLALDGLRSPFFAASGSADTVAAISRRVHLVVAAATRERMQALRNSLVYYGSTYVDWAPYRKQLPDPVAAFATAVARDLDYETDVLPIDMLESRYETIKTGNHMTVVIVDMWATKLGPERAALASFDRRNDLTTAVLVPVNPTDQEMTENWHELTGTLKSVLANSSTRVDYEMFQYANEHHDFDLRLRRLLRVAENQVFRKRQPGRLPPSADERRHPHTPQGM
jgi:FxsC-like protein